VPNPFGSQDISIGGHGKFLFIYFAQFFIMGLNGEGNKIF
jgi:hypothetical protein